MNKVLPQPRACLPHSITNQFKPPLLHMANITTNLIDTNISPADRTTIQTAVNTIKTTLDPYVRNLTEEERDRLLSLDVNNKVFVEEALDEITNNGTMLPAAISASQIENDLALFNQLDSLESVLQNMLDRVRDTKRLTGHEAYAMALAAYTIYKALANSGVEAARTSAERLGQRFVNNGPAVQPAP